MQIDTTLLVNSPEIIQGLLDGSMKRYGSVIRWAAGTENAGQIVRHLAEAPGLTKSIIDGADLISKIGVEKTLSSAMSLTQIAAGASVLNLGVSIIGFAYMGFKLHQVQNSLNHLQKYVEQGFKDINKQLVYLVLLVEDSRKKQQRLAKAISHLQQAMLIKEIAALNAELEDRKRFPNESCRESLKVASRVRLFLANQAIQATPELDAELMLNADISIQGWAVATATEAHLLLEIGQHYEARQLLAVELSKFKQVVERWGNDLINDENPYLSTAYRFNHPRFREYITPARVERIIEISPSDRTLSFEQIRTKKTHIDVEFEMSYSSQWDQLWLHRQIAIAEYLDTLSELLARLDSLQSFATLCESRNVSSSRDILPDSNATTGLYVLPTNE